MSGSLHHFMRIVVLAAVLSETVACSGVWCDELSVSCWQITLMKLVFSPSLTDLSGLLWASLSGGNQSPVCRWGTEADARERGDLCDLHSRGQFSCCIFLISLNSWPTITRRLRPVSVLECLAANIDASKTWIATSGPDFRTFRMTQQSKLNKIYQRCSKTPT